MYKNSYVFLKYDIRIQDDERDLANDDGPLKYVQRHSRSCVYIISINVPLSGSISVSF